MTTLACITGGVDTHKDVHVAAALDHLGRLLGTESFATTRRGYRQLLDWLRSHGEVVAVGVEGCGSWGAGLSRHLVGEDVDVFEVNRPNRQERRRSGKDDPLDAESAARAVQAGKATALPKSGDGPIEAIRQLRVARNGAIKARTAAANQLHALCDTAPDEIRDQLRSLSLRKKVALAERWRPGPGLDLHASTKRAMQSVARRWRALDDEVRDLDAHLKAVLDHLAPALLAIHGVGYETAGQLLVTAGDNPDRLRSERSFARLCGSCPIKANSGKTKRLRLNRGGDRNANAALWFIVRTRMVSHPPTIAYVERRTTEGLSKLDIMRCLKRYVARELYPYIVDVAGPSPAVLPLEQAA
jgi:transposase